MKYAVKFSPAAQSDLLQIYDYIALKSSDNRALAYIERIEKFCDKLRSFPQRGTLRDDLRAGLRTIGFERRVSIAFTLSDKTVTILRILYAGRGLGKAHEPVTE